MRRPSRHVLEGIHAMNSSSLGPIAGLLAGLPAVLAGALGGAPWWAVGAIVIAAYLAVPLTSLILEHSRQRKGTLVDEKFAATLDQITDPEKITAIISYRQATAPPATPATTRPATRALPPRIPTAAAGHRRPHRRGCGQTTFPRCCGSDRVPAPAELGEGNAASRGRAQADLLRALPRGVGPQRQAGGSPRSTSPVYAPSTLPALRQPGPGSAAASGSTLSCR